jgi:DNA-binding response OmpR family regulator
MWGYEADVATSGQLALDMVANNEYDVIICDFLLGTENGLELLERLAQIQSSAVLMLISAALPEDIADKIPGRRIHLIEKPWIGPELRLRLAQALGVD